MCLSLGLGEDASFGDILSFPYLLQLSLAQLAVSVAETKLSSPTFSTGDRMMLAVGLDQAPVGFECAGEWYQSYWSCACMG